ncbi:aldose 1-epimerase family protein [Pontibacter sp. JH31]|uniref:Aldose 1-epimerase family protein n=1 Tax=Pontibacter aquaedesilientis TaxID=2766980 RepID=A0ABR7XJ28_9BACT|nr:aldose 1-epimerase family protein [Pontibacter aquaedesilientis]MBD1398290.1 aldose 1-epimerase family protein [Pontibacter aquaedesilientis]
MLYYLQNYNFRVGVESKGAELQHFIKLDEKLELIWQADPAIWGSHAPNLFPIVGELPEGTYTYDNEIFALKRHGFARHKEFKLIEEEDDKLVFELEDDEETLQVYPFKFRLLIAYKLEKNKLSVTYQVLNRNKKAMFFSIGGHPGFNVPFYPGEQYSDYFIEFEKEETLYRYLLTDDGLQSGDTERVLEQERVLPLKHGYFDKDALVFKNLHSEKLTLGSRTNQRRVEITFPGFPYLGIWAKPGPSPYVCIEPWCGIAGRADETGELEEKEGINKLGPEQAFERTYTIEVL